jgi:hypothetical protein
MISGIVIENFKGIREPVELNLRPLTLLFGANSAGKSTILHALHYAREIFDRHNLNPDRTVSGGEFVDLGGFENFVYGHDLSRQIRIEITLKVTEDDLPDYYSPDDYNPYDELEPLFSGVTEASVAVRVIWSDWLAGPCVNEYVVGFNSRPFARITAQPGRRGAELTEVDLEHPVLTARRDLRRFTEWESWEPSDADDGNYSGLSVLLNKVRRATVHPSEDVFISEPLAGLEDALPVWGRRLGLPTSRVDASPYHPLSPLDDADREELASDNQEINAVLSKLIVGPGEILREALQGLRYLGPLRQTPPRCHVPPRYPDASRWASGLAAWDLLHIADEKFVGSVSRWLGDADRLNSGYRLLLKKYKELDLSDPLVIKLLTGRAFDEAEGDARLALDKTITQSRLVVLPDGSNTELLPHDVGVGISQVIPVIVTALAHENRLIAIEQPELHLHPKLQAELGDLFIEAALGESRNNMVLETHSELIPLRLMRRIVLVQRNVEFGRAGVSELRVD